MNCYFIDISEILQHPAQFYNTPRELLKDVRLTARQKYAILDCWADEQKQMLDAGAENMLPCGGPAAPGRDAAEMLSDICSARTRLEAPPRPRP